MSASMRLGLPLLASGQAQKEITHNEALQHLDIAVAASVQGAPAADPPASPEVGSCYIVAASPGGAWSGHAGKLACFTSAGWRFVAPVEGLRALVRTDGSFAIYRNGAWELGIVAGSRLLVDGKQVVGTQASAIAAPAGGSLVDVECRTALAHILAALRQHGLIEA